MDWHDVLVKKGFEVHVIGTPLPKEAKKPIVNVLMPGQTAGELAISFETAALAVLEQGDWKASKKRWEKLAADKGFGYQTFDVKFEGEPATMWLFQKQRGDAPTLANLPLHLMAAKLSDVPQVAVTANAYLPLLDVPAFQYAISLKQFESSDGAWRWAKAPVEIPGALERIGTAGQSTFVVEGEGREWVLTWTRDGWTCESNGKRDVVNINAMSWEPRAIRNRYSVVQQINGVAVYDFDTLQIVAQRGRLDVLTIQGDNLVVQIEGLYYDVDAFTGERRARSEIKRHASMWRSDKFIVTRSAEQYTLWDAQRNQLATREIRDFEPMAFRDPGELIGFRSKRTPVAIDLHTGAETQLPAELVDDLHRISVNETTMLVPPNFRSAAARVYTRNKPPRWVVADILCQLGKDYVYFTWEHGVWRFKL